MKKELAKEGNGITCPVAIMVKDNAVLAGHRHYTKDKWKEISVWTVPGGRSEREETIEQTLRREVAEEVGITEFKIIDFIGKVPGAKEGDIVAIFYCTTTQEAKLMEPEKFSEWRWIPIKHYVTEKLYSGFNPQAAHMVNNYLLGLNQ